MLEKHNGGFSPKLIDLYYMRYYFEFCCSLHLERICPIRIVFTLKMIIHQTMSLIDNFFLRNLKYFKILFYLKFKLNYCV